MITKKVTENENSNQVVQHHIQTVSIVTQSVHTCVHLHVHARTHAPPPHTHTSFGKPF